MKINYCYGFEGFEGVYTGITCIYYLYTVILIRCIYFWGVFTAFTLRVSLLVFTLRVYILYLRWGCIYCIYCEGYLLYLLWRCMLYTHLGCSYFVLMRVCILYRTVIVVLLCEIVCEILFTRFYLREFHREPQW